MKILADVLYKSKPQGVTTAHLNAAISEAMFRNSSLPMYMGTDYDRNSMAQWLERNISRHEMQSIHEYLVKRYRSTGERAFYKGRPPGAKNKDNDGALRAMRENGTNTEGFESGEDDSAEEMSTDDLARELGLEPVKTEQTLVDLTNYVTKPELHDCVGNMQRAIDRTLDTLEAKVSAIQDARPTVVELRKPDMPAISLGVQHKHFPLLLKMCSAEMRSGSHVNIWLYGPKGSGKTTAAERICEALFGDMSKYHYNGALASAFQVTGFMDANGKYVTTPFRQAWEHGGVYLFDEIDGSMPDALLALNGALANGIASFPDKMVKRHKDCIIIAGANTTGLGGTVEYVGRFKQDAALTDRFCYLDWPHDNGLEDYLCANKDWLRIVRTTRENCQRVKYKGQFPSMRASLYGEALLAADVELQYVIDAVLRKGVADADWNGIRPQ